MRFQNAAIICTLLLPGVALAQPEDFAGFADIFVGVLNSFVPFVITLTVLAVLWGAAQLVLYADNAQKRASARTVVMWGIFVLFIMVSAWGFVNLMKTIFD